MADSIPEYETQMVDLLKSAVEEKKNTRTSDISIFPQIMYFPRELRGSQTDFPFIRFAPIIRGDNPSDAGKSVNLPITPGVNFSDGANYSSIDLGIFGSNALSEITSTINAMGQFEEGSFKSGIEKIKSSVTSYPGYLGMSIAAKSLGFDKASEALKLHGRRVTAPNANTTFSGTNIRGFDFNFKMVAKDQGDAKMIRYITSFFRKHLYPEAEKAGVIFKYPPTWSIRFYDGANEMNYMPKIYESYLTNFSMVVNSSTNAFHTDGAPIEVDISLRMQESKALTQQQIVNLNPIG